MKVVAAIIARMGAERLPAKPFFSLAGKPAIDHVVERLRQVKCADEVAVFTTDTPFDDSLAEHCGKALGLPVFRGAVSPIERVAAGLEYFGADIYLHGAAVDNPLFWWEWGDCMVEALLDEGAEFACLYNPEEKRTIFTITHNLNPYTKEAVDKMLAGARQAGGAFLDHVNLWMLHNPERFKTAFVELGEEVFHWRPLRLKMDTAEDCVVMARVFQAIYKGRPPSTWEAIEYLENNPELARTNLQLGELGNPYYSGDINWGLDWIRRAWNAEMYLSRAPYEATPIWCSSGSCYLGYSLREPGALGAFAERLHQPDGTVIEGDADLACHCGAGRHWYWDIAAMKRLKALGDDWKRPG